MNGILGSFLSSLSLFCCRFPLGFHFILIFDETNRLLAPEQPTLLIIDYRGSFYGYNELSGGGGGGRGWGRVVTDN